MTRGVSHITFCDRADKILKTQAGIFPWFNRQSSFMMLQTVSELLNKNDPEARRQWLAERLALLEKAGQDQLADAVKQEADRLIRVDVQRCQQAADLLGEMARLTGDDLYRALSLLAQGNAYAIGLGEYQKALGCYDEAAEIYRAHGRLVQQAQSQIGKLWPLLSLGRTDEATTAGQWAAEILEAHGEWLALAKLTANMAVIPGRLGQDAEALVLFDRARDLYRQLGAEGEEPLLRLEINRAIVLRNLGRFAESIEANQIALDGLNGLGHSFAAAQAQQNLATTYFVLGRFNEALALLDNAREVFLADGRQRHAMLVELFTSDCLLQLRRFPDVLEKCRRVRDLFSELGANYEVGQAILNEASAYVGLERHDEALASLAEARRLFEQERNRVAVADTDMQVAAVWLNVGQPARSLEVAEACAGIFEAHALPVGQARACLVAARAALALGRHEQAQTLVGQALAVGERHNMPALTYQGHHLRGRLAIQLGQPQEGLAACEQAIAELERLYGRLMIEFRADFVADKERIYQDTVALCLDLDRPQLGLEYSERARSRALQDLLALRLDLSIEARSAADRPLVQELQQLRAERDRLYRRWETGERMTQRGQVEEHLDERHRVEQNVLNLEKRITALWHKLLIRNADYARDAALWQVRTEPIQPYLGADTLLIEYFIAHDQVIVFLVTADEVRAQRLPAGLEQVKQLLQLLWLNLKAVPRSNAGRMASLRNNAQGILGKLYQLLLAPLAEHLPAYHQLIIVPHGPLHYLPFHALYDGQEYLLQRHEVSYLPGASLLRYCREARPVDNGLVAVGHSYEGRLPYTNQEAQTIAGLWSGHLILEETATLEQLRAVAPHSRILHLATHGDFRPDNPLFSGLALADGWLTTLDIFNLRLPASLVTLSACQTGRSVIGGGDELLGMTRAFLSAGAASLVATLWAVEDQSTAELMQAFYQALAAGDGKGAALRQAQCRFLQEGAAVYSHPYFWAPFFLVGDAGPV